MHVAVVGAGAMGCLYGAMFQDAGNDVVFLERDQAVVDAIMRDGLVIARRDGREDTYGIVATSDAAGLARTVDLVLFQVKGFATADAAEVARPIVGPATIILSLQNGLGNEEVLREAFPSNPVVLGISVHSAARLAPGRVLHSGTRATYLGPADDAWAGQADQAAAALDGSGYEVVVESAAGIHREIAAKWVLNCGSLPTAALTGLATDALGKNETVLRLSDALTREACELARLEGHDLDPEERVAYNRELFRTAGGKASMLQDVEAGRRTEIETISGAAVRIADRHGHPAPLNRALYALVKGREAALEVDR